MKREDNIVAITSGLLTVDQQAFEKAATHFGQLYELKDPAKPGFVSLAGTDEYNKPVNYIEWLSNLRAQIIHDLYFYTDIDQNNSSIPPHVEAAFAGAHALQMQVRTEKGISTWSLRTMTSAQYEMKPDQFEALIDAQPQKEKIWERIEEVVNESNRLNERPIVEPRRMAAWLQSDGLQVYNFLISQIIIEVQVECEVLQQPFIVPANMQDLLHKSDLGLFFKAPSESVPYFLYPIAKVTKGQLQDLVNAQTFADEVWPDIEKSLAEYPLVNIPVTGYPSALELLDDAAVNEISHTICRAIAVCCEKRGVPPVIPAHLLHCIGPNELDGKRAQARSRISGGDQLFLQTQKQPWQLYIFTQVPAMEKMRSESDSHLRSGLLSTLTQIASLAQKMQTPYDEAFLAAKFLLSGAVPEGNFDDEHTDRIAIAMEQKGFSPQATEIFRHNFSYAKDQHRLQWTSERILGLCAISMADVFGGMGSWNDLDPGDNAPEYQRLSGDLFEILKRYFATILGN